MLKMILNIKKVSYNNRDHILMRKDSSTSENDIVGLCKAKNSSTSENYIVGLCRAKDSSTSENCWVV